MSLYFISKGVQWRVLHSSGVGLRWAAVLFNEGIEMKNMKGIMGEREREREREREEKKSKKRDRERKRDRGRV